nr:ubiquitin carboxyl-terminal hydrolase 7 [Tanacetum cinerariifolium]
MSSSNHPIIIPSDSDIEDAFSSTNIPDYFPATPRNISSDFLENSKNDKIPPVFSLFYNNPYLKDMQAFYAKESPIPPPDPITPPIILSPSTILPPSLLVIERLIKPAIVDDTPKGKKLMMMGTADEIVKVSEKGPVFMEDLSKEEQVADMDVAADPTLSCRKSVCCALYGHEEAIFFHISINDICVIWLTGKVALPRGRTDKGDRNDIRVALRKAEKKIRSTCALDQHAHIPNNLL